MDEIKIDAPVLSKILGNFTKTTGIASVAVDNSGTPLTPSFGFCEYCKLIRSTPEGLRRCNECDINDQGLYRCHAGLYDGGSQIIINGKCLANIKYGQSADRPLDAAFVRGLAAEFGLPPDTLLAAADKIKLTDVETRASSVELLNAVMDAYTSALCKAEAEKEQKQAEEERTAAMRGLLNRIPTGIATYVVDSTGLNQVFVNTGFYKTLGVTEAEYAQYEGYNNVKGVLPEDLPLVQQQLATLWQGSDSCDFIYRSRMVGHEIVWIRFAGTVANRTETGFTVYAAFTDVTQQMRAHERQQKLFDTIPSGIMEFSYDGRALHVLAANHTLMDMIGFTEQEFAAKDSWNLHTVVHPDDYHLLVEAKNSVQLGKGKTYDFRLFNKKSGIYRWISCDYTVTERTPTKIKLISAFLDVDDKRKAEDASAAKSRFLSRMSHEIRTPINAIMGIAELEKQDVAEGHVSTDDVGRFADETLEASEYLLTLVNDILDTSRIENNRLELQPRLANVKRYMARVSALVEPLAQEKRIHFIFERLTHLYETYLCDGVRIQQIVINLLNNAFKFTPPGGTVRLTCTAEPREQDSVFVTFTVTDNGIGMSREFQETMFTPFVQEDNGNTSPFTGTGLGLNISKNLANLMGGDITCESERGVGTTFTVTLFVRGVAQDQLADTADADAAENLVADHTTSAPLSDAPDLSGVRILVCEDHPLNQKITKALLERRHCTVELAADGVIGVDMFEKSAPGYYSMVLMDIRMPNMDGLEATREMRSLDRPDAKTIPIIAMSANAYNEDVQKSLAAGMNDHLAKPVDAAKLYRTVARLAGLSTGTA